MNKSRKTTVNVKGTAATIFVHQAQDYISLTDIARHKNPELTGNLICNELRNRNAIEFLGVWESLNNPDFKPVEFDGFKKSAGLNSFVLTPRQWIEKTGAIGIYGRATLCRYSRSERRTDTKIYRRPDGKRQTGGQRQSLKTLQGVASIKNLLAKPAP